ncbi:MAG: ABC transporter permease [Actinomycetota bacterium]
MSIADAATSRTKAKVEEQVAAVMGDGSLNGGAVGEALPVVRQRSFDQVVRLYLTEMRLFLRESQVVLFVVGFPVLMVLVLGGVFGTDTDDSGFEFVNPSHYYVASYFGVVLAAIGLMMLPTQIAGARERGLLRRYDTAGFARWVFPTVQYLCGLTFALIGFASLLVTASLTNGVPAPEDLVPTLLGLGLGTLAFISIGVALGMLFPTGRAAQGIGMSLFFPMFLLSGGGPPPEALTDGMRAVANWLPLTHVIRAAQEPWLDIGDGRNHLAIVGGLLVVSLAVWLWRAGRTSRAA